MQEVVVSLTVVSSRDKWSHVGSLKDGAASWRCIACGRVLTHKAPAEVVPAQVQCRSSLGERINDAMPRRKLCGESAPR